MVSFSVVIGSEGFVGYPETVFLLFSVISLVKNWRSPEKTHLIFFILFSEVFLYLIPRYFDITNFVFLFVGAEVVKLKFYFLYLDLHL